MHNDFSTLTPRTPVCISRAPQVPVRGGAQPQPHLHAQLRRHGLVGRGQPAAEHHLGAPHAALALHGRPGGGRGGGGPASLSVRVRDLARCGGGGAGWWRRQVALDGLILKEGNVRAHLFFRTLDNL